MERLFETPSHEVATLTTLGIHHEQQHQELLLTDIKHLLWQNPTFPIYKRSREVSAQTTAQAPPLTYVGFEGGTCSVGHGGEEFHFDNEGPRHRTLVADFELATRPVSNGDVLSFIEAGGYNDPLLWLSDGWAFKCTTGLTHPLYFLKNEDDSYDQFTHHGRIPLDPAETAAHLTYFEADAIARFFGARLPTEQEWECAASRQSHVANAFSADRLRPGRPNTTPPGELSQMIGGVWEWTQSPYVAYPGYAPPPGAVGEYNGKFMHNQFVLRGGSCATPPGHIRTTYRNFFPSSAQWQFTGVRFARGNETP
jgi:ergothioneine biosynthesis protein EgtB